MKSKFIEYELTINSLRRKLNDANNRIKEIENDYSNIKPDSFICEWKPFELGVTELEHDKKYLVFWNNAIAVLYYNLKSLYNYELPPKSFYYTYFLNKHEARGVTHYCSLDSAYESLRNITKKEK